MGRLSAGRRGEKRRRLDLPCRVRLGSSPWRPARIFDLSTKGVLVSWQPQCTVGQTLWVRLPGLEAMPATVRWKDMSGVGCELDRPLSTVVVDHLARNA